VSKRSEL